MEIISTKGKILTKEGVDVFMSSFHPKEAQISEPLPCPECGEIRLSRTMENCLLGDGVTIKKLRHYKCHSCGARFFDDDAMHHIQKVREKQDTLKVV